MVTGNVIFNVVHLLRANDSGGGEGADGEHIRHLRPWLTSIHCISLLVTLLCNILLLCFLDWCMVAPKCGSNMLNTGFTSYSMYIHTVGLFSLQMCPTACWEDLWVVGGIFSLNLSKSMDRTCSEFRLAMRSRQECYEHRSEAMYCWRRGQQKNLYFPLTNVHSTVASTPPGRCSTVLYCIIRSSSADTYPFYCVNKVLMDVLKLSFNTYCNRHVCVCGL